MTGKVEQRNTEMVDAAESLGISQEEYDKIVDECIFGKEEPKCMFTKDSYTDEDRKVLCEDCEEKCEYSKKEQPVSDDLEAEIIRYIGYPQEVDEDICTTMIRKAARHFAEWQKQQMMKDAVGAEVTYGKSLAVPSLGYALDKKGLDYGDKAKLIIIKED